MARRRLSIRVRGAPRKIDLGPADSPWSILFAQLQALEHSARERSIRFESALSDALSELFETQATILALLAPPPETELPKGDRPMSDRRASKAIRFEQASSTCRPSTHEKSTTEAAACRLRTPKDQAPDDLPSFDLRDLEVLDQLSLATRLRLLSLLDVPSDGLAASELPAASNSGSILKTILTRHAITILLGVESTVRSCICGSPASRRLSARIRDTTRLAKALQDLADRLDRRFGDKRREH